MIWLQTLLTVPGCRATRYVLLYTSPKNCLRNISFIRLMEFESFTQKWVLQTVLLDLLLSIYYKVLLIWIVIYVLLFLLVKQCLFIEGSTVINWSISTSNLFEQNVKLVLSKNLKKQRHTLCKISYNEILYSLFIKNEQQIMS